MTAQSILKKILPWPLMEPSERTFWESYIGTLTETSHPNGQSRVLFRGISSRPPPSGPNGQPYQLAVGILRAHGSNTLERIMNFMSEQVRHGNVEFAPVEEYRPEPGEQAQKKVEDTRLYHARSIAALMSHHAAENGGSELVGFSNLEFASNYGPQVIAVLVHPDRTFYNFTSIWGDNEREVFAGFFTFADETVGFSKDIQAEGARSVLQASVEERLKRKLRPRELSKAAEESTSVDEGNADVRSGVRAFFERLKALMPAESRASAAMGVMSCVDQHMNAEMGQLRD